MTEGRLYFLNKLDPNRPIEEKYVTEINGNRESFINQDDALLFLFDNGIKNYKYLTKEVSEYKNLDNLLSYELWQLRNRVGYVLYELESYVNQEDVIQKRKAYIWRFVGFGRSCFAETKEELKEKVIALIDFYNEDPKDYGHSKYPYYTQYTRV